MLSEDDIDALVDEIVGGAEARYIATLNNQLLDALKTGVLDGKARQTLETLSRANSAAVDTLTLKYRDQISEEAKTVIEMALVSATAEDMRLLNESHGPTSTAKALSKHFQAISAETAQGVAEVIGRENIAMADAAKTMWYQAAGDAITAINHGLEKRDRVIATAVDKLTAASLSTIDYKSGISSQLDVAVRRHIVTQVSQAGGRMTMEAMTDVGHTLVVVSAHYGARPSHAEWQGKAYSLHEGGETVGGVFYPDFYASTGYEGRRGPYTALGDRLKGVNCKHSFGPYYPGISDLPDTDFEAETKHFGQSSEDYYNATQRQRELEGRIRQTKRDIYGLEKEGLGLESPAYVQKRLVLGRQQRELASWCDKNRLQRIEKYEKAYGIGAQPRALYVSSKDINSYKRVNKRFNKILGDHSIETDATAVNPEYATGLWCWTNNCQRCAPTYELRRRGIDVVANKATSDNTLALKKNITKAFDGAEIIECSGNGVDDIERQMKEWGDGARAEIIAVWRGGGGHAFSAEQVDGKTVFIDPQAGVVDVRNYFDNVRSGGVSFFRTDNVSQSKLIGEYCRNRTR